MPAADDSQAASAPTSKSFAEEAVDLVDLDGSGTLNREEVRAVLCILALESKEKLELEKSLFDGKAADEEVKADEILTTLTTVAVRSPDEVEEMLDRVMTFRRAFENTDVDQSGKLSLKEIDKALRRLGSSKEDLAEIVALLDEDGSGEISWLEFVEGVTSHADKEELFAQFNVEALADLPNYMNAAITVDFEEMHKTVDHLPLVERLVVRLLGYWYRAGSASPTSSSSSGPTPSSRSQVQPSPRSPKEAWNSSGNDATESTLPGAVDDYAETTSQDKLPQKKAGLVANSVTKPPPAAPPSLEDTITSDVKALTDRATRLSSVKSKRVNERKVHVLSAPDRRRLTIVSWATVFAGCLAGAVAGGLSYGIEQFTENMMLHPGHPGGPDHPEAANFAAQGRSHKDFDELLFMIITGCASLIWSLTEIIICILAGVIATFKMAQICGLVLWPVEYERAMIIGSLMRAALELGHPQDVTLGVNPQKNVSQTWMFVKAMLYLGRRGIVKFGVRFALKKVAPRTAVKFLAVSTVWIEIAVNILFNFLAVKSCMNETSLCCIGPSAITEVVHKALNERRQLVNARLPILTKLMCLRAVGVSVVNKCIMHPNNRHLLQYLSTLLVDEKFVNDAVEEQAELLDKIESVKSYTAEEVVGVKKAALMKKHLKRAASKVQKMEVAVGNPLEKVLKLVGASKREQVLEQQAARLQLLDLDDISSFMALLPMLPAHEVDLVLSILVLAFACDASVGMDEWRFVEEVATLCDPPRTTSWLAMQQVVSMFSAGEPLRPADLRNVTPPLDGVSARKASATAMMSSGSRRCISWTNIF